ncbi:unnamed protein product, partial [Medioppia subpectinata]
MAFNLMNSRQLYKYLYKNIRRLPSDLQNYYRSHVRGQFNSHSDEEPERVRQLIQKGIQDSDWLFYTKVVLI